MELDEICVCKENTYNFMAASTTVCSIESINELVYWSNEKWKDVVWACNIIGINNLEKLNEIGTEIEKLVQKSYPNISLDCMINIDTIVKHIDNTDKTEHNLQSVKFIFYKNEE